MSWYLSLAAGALLLILGLVVVVAGGILLVGSEYIRSLDGD